MTGSNASEGRAKPQRTVAVIPVTIRKIIVIKSLTMGDTVQT